MEAGNPLGNRYPNHTRHWWPLVEDILNAGEVKGLRQRIFVTLEQDREFEVEISYDLAGTDVRNSACFGDDRALRRILTIRGRRLAKNC